MYSRNTFNQAEQLAKKHGQASNQRSTFKYLMKEKTHRSGKSFDEKQNQEHSTILSMANKFAMPLQQHKVQTQNKEVEFSIVPLSNYVENKNQKKTIPQYTESKKVIEKEDVIEFLKEFEKKKVLVEMGSSSIIANVENSQIACMTEDCYYQKELQIKISLLQRERDQLWDSITGIVKENMTLKEMMANLTINTEVIKREEASTQTTQIQTAEIDIQTQMTGEEIQSLEKEFVQTNSSITQTIDFCRTICFQDEKYGQMEWKNLKDAVCQCINSKITISYSQFEAESAILVQLNEHLQQKLKDSTDVTSKILAEKTLQQKKFAQKEEIIEEKLQQMLAACQQQLLRKQKQLNTEINNLHKKIAENQQIYHDKIEELTKIKDQQYKNAEAETKLTKQLLQKSKQGWEQRQKLFSTLLAEAHKTINSLMDQMKDFESQANANYSKQLKTQRVLWGIQHISE